MKIFIFVLFLVFTCEKVTLSAEQEIKKIPVAAIDPLVPPQAVAFSISQNEQVEAKLLTIFEMVGNKYRAMRAEFRP